MAYIGNGRTLLILGSNVRDDIIPGYQTASSPDPFDKTTFELTQEVPGGYENNIYVFKQTYITEVLVTGTSLIDFTEDNLNQQFSITTSDASLASALSDIKETTKTYSEQNHTLTISGATATANNGTFPVISLTYNGASTTIVLSGNGSQVTTATETSINISHGYSGFWEVLEPEVDYTIGGTGATQNREITFTKAPQLDDKVYVIHKGDATYNLVPSDNSVGPEQLSQNLRNFVCDKFTGDNLTVAFTLSQESVSAQAILVSVDGVVKQETDDYTLNATGDEITFITAPASSAKIRVLHLGFSTVSRRSAISPGQAGAVADGSITTAKLATSSVTEPKIASSAVTNTKIANDAVTSTKIRLANNTALRLLRVDGTTVYSALKLNATDQLILDTPTTAHISVAGTKKLNISSTEILPETTETISIGSTTKKFVDAHLSGELSSSTANVTGNIAVGGTVDGVDIAALNTTVSNLQSLVNNLNPIGTIVNWTTTTAPNSQWKICDGSAISRTTYATLFTLIGTAFGSGDGSSTFNLPDMRRRVPIGKSASDTIGNTDGLLEASRLLNHTHSVPAHTHDLSAHTHSIPAHYHGMGTGADLNIGQANGTNADKGGHTTTIDISHGHTASSGNNTAGLTANATLANVSLDDPGHSHGGNTGSTNPTHSHTGTTNSAGSHDHNLRVEGTSGTATVISLVNNQSSGNTDRSDIDNDGVHTHTFTTNSTSINHSHTIDSGTTGITLSQTNHSHTVDAHNHTITVNALGTTNKTDTSGIHSHGSANFAGSIGLVTGGVNGNATMTSGAPSVDVTGNSTVLTTGSQINVPYTILNFIIRVA